MKPLRSLMDRVRRVYLIGESAADLEAQLDGAVDSVFCDDLDAAVAQAAKDARKSKAKAPVVLLSPACASYDQFANFEARGDAFRAAVEALSAKAVSSENGEAA